MSGIGRRFGPLEALLNRRLLGRCDPEKNTTELVGNVGNALIPCQGL